MLVLRKEYGEYYEPKKAEELPDNDVPDLFEAAACGSVKELDEALKHWDINAIDENGMTALHWAAVRLKFDNVDRLLEEADNGLVPDVKDKFGRNPSWVVLDVHGTADERANKMRNKLSPYVYPPSEEDLALYESAGEMDIFEAARSPDIHWLNEALERCDVSEKDEQGWTALHHASYVLNFAQADRLLREVPNGLDVTAVDDEGRNAAQVAFICYGEDNLRARRMYDKLKPFVEPDSTVNADYASDDAPEI